MTVSAIAGTLRNGLGLLVQCWDTPKRILILMRMVMFDRVIFNTKIDFAKEALRIAEANHLHRHDDNGKFVYYESSAFGKFEGVRLKIRSDGTMQIICSLHSLYYKWKYGILDNSGFFSMRQAMETAKALFDRIGIGYETTVITYYEIGLNLPMRHDPSGYIRKAYSIGSGGEKVLFNDANFQRDRQRTTEKSHTIKKVFKMYDKSFEYREKRKTVADNILRIETMYRRQKIPLSEFTSTGFADRQCKRFLNDWGSVSFPWRIEAEKGVGLNQKQQAYHIMSMGVDGYLKYLDDSYKAGDITIMQKKTGRAFAREWDRISCKFRQVADNEELEFKEKLSTLLKEATES